MMIERRSNSGALTAGLGVGVGLAVDVGEGVTVGDALNAIGYAGTRPVSGHKVGAYFEAHIEQGPILEDEHKTIGVVLGAEALGDVGRIAIGTSDEADGAHWEGGLTLHGGPQALKPAAERYCRMVLA